MKKIKVFKMITGLATSFGVGTIVSNGVKLVNAGANLNPVMKICVAIGSFAISGMVAEQASDYLDKQIDSVVESFKTTVKEDEENGES